MSEPLRIRMGGYGPPTTSFSRALQFIGGGNTAVEAERFLAAASERAEAQAAE